jgi:hypothetical protein
MVVFVRVEDIYFDEVSECANAENHTVSDNI